MIPFLESEVMIMYENEKDPGYVTYDVNTDTSENSSREDNNTTVNFITVDSSPAEPRESAAQKAVEVQPASEVVQPSRGVYSNSDYSSMAGGRTYNTGDSGNAASSEAAYAVGRKAKRKRKEKGSAKTGGFWKKVLVSVSLGLLFGLFAGIGFYGIQQGIAYFSPDAVEEVSGTPGEVFPGSIPAGPSEGIALNNTDSVTVVQANVVEVAEEVMPAMVSIVNRYTVTGSFFGQTYKEEQASSGSGIIVSKTDSELLIVSNNHVVNDAEKLELTFIDGAVAEAHIKGLDSQMDLAVIAVDLKDISEETLKAITVATLGNSDDLKLGEPVIAIGNALGYGQSVTDGIVSALNRELTMEDGSKGIFIQTNAAINPGNSGGALLNVKGEVIGINTSKIGGTAIEGMGYAIPITSASPIIADLMERQTRNKVAEGEQGYLGISIQIVTAQISSMYNWPQGIYVLSIEEGSAAEKAGLMVGDIITGFDGDKILTYEDLQEVLQYYKAGADAKITVMRPENGKYVQHDLQITLGERPKDKK